MRILTCHKHLLRNIDKAIAQIFDPNFPIGVEVG